MRWHKKTINEEEAHGARQNQNATIYSKNRTRILRMHRSPQVLGWEPKNVMCKSVVHRSLARELDVWKVSAKMMPTGVFWCWRTPGATRRFPNLLGDAHDTQSPVLGHDVIQGLRGHGYPIILDVDADFESKIVRPCFYYKKTQLHTSQWRSPHCNTEPKRQWSVPS